MVLKSESATGPRNTPRSPKAMAPPNTLIMMRNIDIDEAPDEPSLELPRLMAKPLIKVSMVHTTQQNQKRSMMA